MRGLDEPKPVELRHALIEKRLGFLGLCRDRKIDLSHTVHEPGIGRGHRWRHTGSVVQRWHRFPSGAIFIGLSAPQNGESDPKRYKDRQASWARVDYDH